MSKGRKGCPNCLKTVGARTRLCLCGYDFFKNKIVGTVKTLDKQEIPVIKTEEQLTEEKYVSDFGNGKCKYIVYAGSGKCPIEFQQDDDPIDWCHKVIDEGLKYNKLYFSSALLHFLHQFVDPNCRRYFELRSEILDYLHKE